MSNAKRRHRRRFRASQAALRWVQRRLGARWRQNIMFQTWESNFGTLRLVEVYGLNPWLREAVLRRLREGDADVSNARLVDYLRRAVVVLKARSVSNA